MKNVARRLVLGLFNFSRILSKKESEEAFMLIWTNLDSLAITYPIYACFTNICIYAIYAHFPIEIVLISLQTRRSLELVFRS